ncbi:MAG: hypothetical protein C0392_00175 [Syntrophus sp. (in: bacteria)]|nr:hypothetical protein [Syntrophus sp. (in: bacteria)]
MDNKNKGKLEISVLYVENESTMREKIAEILRNQVKNVYIAKDGIEGLNIFREHRPEIIITNLTLPKLSGLDMVRKIKEGGDDPHIIMAVARNDLDYLFESIDLSISRYLLKPLEKEKLVSAIRDISKRKEIEQTVLDEKEKFQILSENAPLGIMLIDKDGRLKYINPKIVELFGYQHNEIPDAMAWFIKIFPESGYPHNVIVNWINDMEDSIHEKKEPWVHTSTCKNGVQKIVDFFPARLSTGELVIFCDDLTELKKNEQKLFYITRFDALTGLPNRHSMEETLRQTVELSKNGRKRGGLGALLFMDLDGFREINTTLGHTVGDELLIATGKMLKGALRTGDSAYRFGGDEFIVIFKGVSMAEAKLAAERIQRTVNQHEFSVDYKKFTMDISMGLIQIDGTIDPVTLLSKVVDTLYKARKLGRNHIAIYRGE